MKNIKIHAVIIISILVLASYVRIRAIYYESYARKPKPSSFPIEIYDSSDLTRDHKVIGLVIANAGKLHATQDIVDTLKTLARNMGGDALLDMGISTSDGRIIQKTNFGYVAASPRENWAVKVIIWTKEIIFDFKIRIVKQNAALKIKPDEESQNIKFLPIGAIFEIESQIGEWLKIKLPVDKDGITVTGYLHESYVEYEKKNTH